MKKLNEKSVISDTNKKSLKIKKFLLTKITLGTLKKSSLIIVIMEMVLCFKLQKNYRLKKLSWDQFGNYGFLMNKLPKIKLIKNLQAKIITISPLIMKVRTKTET